MDNTQINQLLIDGALATPGLLPHVEALKYTTFVFEQDFGLPELPSEPGLIIVRGPRQYGKSTWLEQQIANTIKSFGKGSALYLNGDEIISNTALLEEIRSLVPLFNPTAKVKRLFIDEITAIENWQNALKRLIDAGELRDILIVTTGSKATDLRRGAERLPGRKGKLARTNYIFTPVSYSEFKRKCGKTLGKDTLYAYILSGGSPVAANAIATDGLLPDYVTAITSDWILGEFAASGRTRANLLAVLQSLYRLACTPIGQAKLARESGLSNNTVALGYIDLLSDLMCVMPAYPIDTEKNITLFRKPCKYHFTNVLAALTWHPQKPRTVKALQNLGEDLGAILEWVVAQELWRRACIKDAESLPEYLTYWQSDKHEIDFVTQEQLFIEVKKGKENPINFRWFLKNHPKKPLWVINQAQFEAERITGITLEDFLLES